jgi:hypothetical protein
MSVKPTHIGTKLVRAEPMTRLQYNVFRGWTVPVDEAEDDPGMMVEYLDGGKANTERFAGYISWSPMDVFELAYRPFTGLTFGLAVEAMKRGARVARQGWNGKGMFLFLVPGSEFQVSRPPLLGIYPEGTPITYGAHIDIKAADGSIRPWVASQSDILVEDWVIVEDAA